MRTWVSRQLGGVLRIKPLVILDPFGIAPTAEEVGIDHDAIHEVADWYSLRRVWERAGRNHAGQAVAIVVSDASVRQRRDLPWDIENSAAVVRLDVPGTLTDSVRTAFLSLSSDAADRLASDGKVTLAEVVGALVGIDVPSPPWRAATELQIAARLIVRPGVPQAVLAAASDACHHVVARSLLRSPVDSAPLAEAWTQHLSGIDGPDRPAYDAATPDLIALFASGHVPPVNVAAGIDIPAWAAATATTDPATVAEALLADRPEPLPTSFTEWSAAAAWWGLMRDASNRIRGGSSDFVERADAVWHDMDAAFGAWLRSGYGQQFQAPAVAFPTMVHHVPRFLARRSKDSGRKVLLIVLDGCGLAQWTALRRVCSFDVAEHGAILATVPTLTEYSRLSIMAGALPATRAAAFADLTPDAALRRALDLSKEATYWGTFWSSEAGGVQSAVYLHVAADLADPSFPPPTSTVAGIVVNAVDDLMHLSAVIGDAGLTSQVEEWGRRGELDELVARADALGFDSWITADHGNVACQRAANPNEGLFVERAGERVRRYASRELRDAGRADGVVWDSLPGLPPGVAERLVFARGRQGFGTHGVAHGGLSIDEVFVPFARVTPA